MLRSLVFLVACLALTIDAAPAAENPVRKANQEVRHPNVLLILADDIGYWNVSAYSQGMMVPTPGIDRIAREGLLFTDHYAEPSCTAGRAAYLTGQYPIRTGLTTVGLPHSPVGHDRRDPSIAEVLKTQGYRTGYFGKSHLGDRDEHIPTAHGFDEFFGDLYHLNSEEEPEQLDYPKDPEFRRKYGPRGVIESTAGSPVREAGPLTAKRMETFDEEITAHSIDFMRRAVHAGEPFFVSHNPTRNHIYLHFRPGNASLAAGFSSEEDSFGSGMVELDRYVGRLLRELDDLGIAKNTIVIFTSDNGPMYQWWPQGGTSPFRGGKASTWEGGVRVPMLVRWPGHIEAGRVSNDIQSHLDLFTTIAAAAGRPDVAEELRISHHVHIDGVNNLGHWLGRAPSARTSYLYYNESVLSAVRIGPWKGHFRVRDDFFDYSKPASLLFNLRMDPFEQHDGMASHQLAMRKAWFGGLMQDILQQHMASLREFPPRQAPGSLVPREGTRQVPAAVQ